MDEDPVQAALNQINARLDYTEDHIVDMSHAGARLPYVATGRADRPPTDLGLVPPEVVELVRAGKAKDAVVRYRGLTGASIDQAKAALDGL